MDSRNFAHIHDVIGIGFGPSNIALAIALEEIAETTGRTLDKLFIEKQADYSWHGNTLIEQSELQISFLKDLVSLRNPQSPYTFVKYLHQQGRLIDFINLGTFYPCRLEFNDYLRWVAEHFDEHVVYGQAATRVEPVQGPEGIEHIRVISTDAQGQEHVRHARSVVVSTGGTPRIPALFAGFKDDARVFHHSRYLSSMAIQPCVQGKPMRIAIVGSGQSAAEAFIDLHDRFPSVSVEMILRGSALKPADDSAFVNEIFSPAYTDLVFNQAPDERQRLINEYHNTNYAVVDLELIERIYGILYRQKVARNLRHTFSCRQDVISTASTPEGVELTLKDLATGHIRTERYDAVVLATGYERRSHLELLEPLGEYLEDFQVDRDYRALAQQSFKPPIFLQGFCEASHGLSDTLLSVLPARSEEIGTALYQALTKSVANIQDHHASYAVSV